MIRRGRRHAAIAAVLATTLAACSIATDEGPRDIPEDERRDINPPGAPAASVGETRIFLVAEDDDGDGRVLRPVARDVGDSPSQVLEALLQGRTEEEQEQGMHTVLPEELDVQMVPNFPQEELVIVANSALSDLPGDTRVLAVGQIVVTLTSLDTVSEVELELAESEDGENDDPPQWPTSNGELVDRPLTLYDYLGLLDTNQPEHPPVPSELADGDSGRTSTGRNGQPGSGGAQAPD